MRVDLGLKSFQLTLSLLLLFMYVLCHQVLDLVCHYIKGCGQAANLILRRNHDICCLKVSFLHLLHGITKLLDGKGNASGYKA